MIDLCIAKWDPCITDEECGYPSMVLDFSEGFKDQVWNVDLIVNTTAGEYEWTEGKLKVNSGEVVIEDERFFHGDEWAIHLSYYDKDPFRTTQVIE